MEKRIVAAYMAQGPAKGLWLLVIAVQLHCAIPAATVPLSVGANECRGRDGSPLAFLGSVGRRARDSWKDPTSDGSALPRDCSCSAALVGRRQLHSARVAMSSERRSIFGTFYTAVGTSAIENVQYARGVVSPMRQTFRSSMSEGMISRAVPQSSRHMRSSGGWWPLSVTDKCAVRACFDNNLIDHDGLQT